LNVDPQPLAQEIRRSLGAKLPEVWSPSVKPFADQRVSASDAV
jgi:hypothetical protein